MKEFNPDSPQQVGTVLFGGETSFTERKQVGVYKNGKPKFSTAQVTLPVIGKYPKEHATLTPTGEYQTDEATLSRLVAADFLAHRRKFVELLMEYREMSKELKTYWVGLGKHVMVDGYIHHKLNHTATRTGRLSSSSPNMQNIANSEVKKVFISRWGSDGSIVEADFKQLEMLELAFLSKDPQLLADLRDGVDMHDALYQGMYGLPMPPEHRKQFKRCSFALIYGAGAAGIAEQGGITKAEAARFISQFYSRYVGVMAYHGLVTRQANLGAVYAGRKDKATLLPLRDYVDVDARTKRRYSFHEYVGNFPKPGTTSFSPNELKNYPVQGGATGDKVPLCVGALHRVLRNHPNPLMSTHCLMINTIHDSILFDVHNNVLVEAVSTIKQVMESTPELYERAFGCKLPLPMKVSISTGPNWFEQTETS
jgi:DNA polymerase I